MSIKISELTNLNDVAKNDLMPIVDVSAGVTNNVTVSSLANAMVNVIEVEVPSIGNISNNTAANIGSITIPPHSVAFINANAHVEANGSTIIGGKIGLGFDIIETGQFTREECPQTQWLFANISTIKENNTNENMVINLAFEGYSDSVMTHIKSVLRALVIG